MQEGTNLEPQLDGRGNYIIRTHEENPVHAIIEDLQVESIMYYVQLYMYSSACLQHSVLRSIP